MAENNINAYCSICGQGYHICSSCLEQKTFKPWKTVVDSIEHYKIYLAIHGYTISKDKKKAKAELQVCNLSDSENFKPEIKDIIKEIMMESKKTRTVSKKEENIETKIKKEENNINE